MVKKNFLMIFRILKIEPCFKPKSFTFLKVNEFLTKEIKKGAETLQMSLIDHIILSGDNEEYFSFCDEGIL